MRLGHVNVMCFIMLIKINFCRHLFTCDSCVIISGICIISGAWSFGHYSMAEVGLYEKVLCSEFCACMIV